MSWLEADVVAAFHGIGPSLHVRRCERAGGVAIQDCHDVRRPKHGELHVAVPLQAGEVPQNINEGTIQLEE